MNFDALPERVRVHIEVPKGSRITRNSKGGIDCVSPFPCPFNYGSVPDTQGEDGEPIDAVVLGGPLPLGHSGDYRIVGWVKFIDGGEEDPKLICIQSRFSEVDKTTVIDFFERYAKLKRPLNQLRFKRGPTEFRGFVERPGSAKTP